MLPSDIKDLYKSYQSIYQQEDDDISSEMIEEIVEELVEECLEFGYTLDEATNAIQEAAELYFDAEELEEAKVTYGSDTESPEERTARAKERLGGRKATARKAAVKGAVDRVTAKAKGIKAGAEIAGSIAKDEARRAGRGALHAVGKAASAVASAPGRAYKAVTDAARAKKAEVKQGVKSLLGRGLRKAAGAAGVVAQKARKAGAAAGKAAERLGEEIISEDPVQDFRDMKRAKENAAGMRGPELSHSAKPAGSAAQKPQPRSREFEKVAPAATQPRSREFSHGTKSLKSIVKGGLTMSYEPEGENVDENIQSMVNTGLNKSSNFMKTNPVGKAASAVLSPVGSGRKTPTATSGGYRKEQYDSIDENVGGSVKMKPGSGLGGGTPVYPKGQEPKATGAKLPSLQNAHYEYNENDIYDLVMEYLLGTEQVETISEAQYVMSQMDVEMITNVVEAMTNYEKNRKRAAQRAAERNAARDRDQTGAVPGVGYVTPRRERETWTDESGQERHTSGARMPDKKK